MATLQEVEARAKAAVQAAEAKLKSEINALRGNAATQLAKVKSEASALIKEVEETVAFQKVAYLQKAGNQVLTKEDRQLMEALDKIVLKIKTIFFHAESSVEPAPESEAAPTPASATPVAAAQTTTPVEQTVSFAAAPATTSSGTDSSGS